MIKVNCDIGERGGDHGTDIALLNFIQIANLACGGHAGSRDSVYAFLDRCRAKGIDVSAHLSYPDRKNFGRASMVIPLPQLLQSLDEQLALMPAVTLVKFHGALYNESAGDCDLADALAAWLKKREITEIVAPQPSEIASSCEALGIGTLAEAFAERRYTYSPEDRRLRLVSRTKDYASIADCDEAVAQARHIVQEGRVEALIERDDGTVARRWIDIEADTVCIHSDSPIALELARRMARI
jgi:UPF0271 protein